MTTAGVTDTRIAKALDRALELGERGVQVAAYIGDQIVIDEFVGVTDNATGGIVTGGTLFPVFSVTKVATAIAVHLQVERGLISYDDPIAKHWPEFAKRDKARITVAHVLSHQSGIPQMPKRVTPELMCDWDWMIGQIEDFTPFFEAGTKNAYQSLIHGWILGEVVRRTDPHGRAFGDFVREEICLPLKMNDFWIGLPAREISRVAVLTSELSNIPAPNETEESRAAKPASVALDAPVHNRHDVWQACLPATGAIMSARSGARLFAMLANGGVLDGVRFLPEELVRSFTTPRPHAEGMDLVMFGGNRDAPPVGIGGMWLDGTIMGGGPGVLCHTGVGGTFGFADLDSGLSVVLCHNRLFDGNRLAGRHPFHDLVNEIRGLVASRGAQ